jgi:hypothetical protein
VSKVVVEGYCRRLKVVNGPRSEDQGRVGFSSHFPMENLGKYSLYPQRHAALATACFVPLDRTEVTV